MESAGSYGVSYPEDVRVIRKSSFTQSVSDLLDEHQFPIILRVRVDGLDELSNRTTHITPAFSCGVPFNTLYNSYGHIHCIEFLNEDSVTS